MTISAVSSTDTSLYTTSTSATSDQIDNPNSELGKTDFLEMLITKLKYQDPLSVEDSDFTGDMAEYSSLEQMTNINDAITEMSGKIDDLNTNILGQLTMENTTQAVSLVGKSVSIETTDDSGNITASDSGAVSVVRFVDGIPKVVVNGTEYDLSAIKEVSSS